ncbi:oligosaccharyl transferase, archaeosortase A system-associated [Chloroflexota bacterium]
MSVNRVSVKLIAGIVVAIIFGVALYFRIVLPHDHIFADGFIKFIGNDAYFHMRIVDNLAINFPDLNSIDPYLLYPDAMPISSSFRLYDYLLAGIAWLVGNSSPSHNIVDIVGVYVPAILGSLTIITVFFIGRELFNLWAGIIAAGLIAIFPGEFLNDSMLGSTDHHVAEVLLTSLIMLFLILAIKSARQKQLTFSDVKSLRLSIVVMPLIYTLIAGIFLGAYLLTWMGALLIVLIIFIYLLIQFTIEHFKGINGDYLCLIFTMTFFIGLIMFLPSSPSKVYIVTIIIALIAPITLYIISRLLHLRRLRSAYYPLALVIIGLIGFTIMYFITPELISSMLSRFSMIIPTGTKLTILQAQPFFFEDGDFSLSFGWHNFTTSLFIGFISLGILIYYSMKKAEGERTLFIVWSIAILLITLFMKRFVYYFTVNIALLTGYAAWLIICFLSQGKMALSSTRKIRKTRRRIARETVGRGGFTINDLAGAGIGIVIVFFICFFPNINPAIANAKEPAYTPNEAWCESLSWLKNNTPEPFDNPDFYYSLYESPFISPHNTYGVAAWWDYGYWITRIGHRVPNCNPGSQKGRADVAEFLTSQDEISAAKTAAKLRSKYIIVDFDTATAKFWSMTSYIETEKSDFLEIYYKRQLGKLQPIQIFYPEYYRSMAVRLYNFDTASAIPIGTMVISYEEKINSKGANYKEIIDSRTFPSFEEAKAYIADQKSGNHRVAGTDPFISPVPLDTLTHYKPVFSSSNANMIPDVGRVALVKVFEYVKSDN